MVLSTLSPDVAGYIRHGHTRVLKKIQKYSFGLSSNNVSEHAQEVAQHMVNSRTLYGARQCARMHKCKKKFNVVDKYTVSRVLKQVDNFDLDVDDGQEIFFEGEGAHCYLPRPGFDSFEDGDRDSEDNGP